MKRILGGGQKLQGLGTPTTNNRTLENKGRDGDLQEFLSFELEGDPTAEIKQEENVGEPVNSDEQLIDVDFEMNGQKISAKVTSSMVEVLRENETLRQELVEKLLADSECNPGEQLIITEGPKKAEQSSKVAPAPQPPVISKTRRLSTNSKDITKAVETARTVNKVLANGTKSSQNGAQGRAFLPSAYKAPTSTAVAASTLKKLNPGEDDAVVTCKELLWDRQAIWDLLGSYREVTSKTLTKPDQNIWPLVYKKMKKKNYAFSVEALEKKFIALSKTYSTRLQTKTQNSWPYSDKMDGLPLQLEELPKTARPCKSTDESDDELFSSSSSLSSDNDDESDGQSSTKKRKLSSTETWGVELFRRTYLKMEKQKLREMREMRKQYKRLNALQAERNILLRELTLKLANNQSST